jgi:hypothetical protein
MCEDAEAEAEAMEVVDRVAILKDGIGQVDTSPQCRVGDFRVSQRAALVHSARESYPLHCLFLHLQVWPAKRPLTLSALIVFRQCAHGPRLVAEASSLEED